MTPGSSRSDRIAPVRALGAPGRLSASPSAPPLSPLLAAVLAPLLAACSFKTISGGAADGRTDGPPGTPLRKLLTIDAKLVTGTHTGFPVWISLDDDKDLAEHATEDGGDIYFTARDGTPIPHEIQRWTRATGRLEAWVRADLDDVTDTVLELRYGDPSTARPPDPPQVFSSSFVAVWHLDDPLGTRDVADATGMHPGIAGGLTPADQLPAQLGGGFDFDGTSKRVNFRQPLTGGVEHTISAWVKQRTASSWDSIVTIGNPDGSKSRWFHSHYTNGISAGFYGNDWSGTLPNIDNAGWTLLHWTYRNRQSHMYRDGVEVGAHMFNAGVDTQGTDGNLGYAPAQWGQGGTPCWLNGMLDEVRIATAERSAGWIATEHANQRMPLKFYAVGPEEQVP